MLDGVVAAEAKLRDVERQRMSSIRVQSAEGLRKLRELGEAVFDLNSRLPSVVSSLASADAPFFDGDIVLGGSGWELASSLALAHGDPTVNVLMLDPDPAEFFSSTGEYGCFSCASDAARDSYVAGLFGDPREVADQIGYVAETVAVFGASGRWGIWAERNIAGLVVSAEPSALGAWELDNGPFLTVDEALDEFLGLNLGVGAAGLDFAIWLRRNYGALPDPREEPV